VTRRRQRPARWGITRGRRGVVGASRVGTRGEGRRRRPSQRNGRADKGERERLRDVTNNSLPAATAHRPRPRPELQISSCALRFSGRGSGWAPRRARPRSALRYPRAEAGRRRLFVGLADPSPVRGDGGKGRREKDGGKWPRDTRRARKVILYTC
jgi:hypothetical protein